MFCDVCGNEMEDKDIAICDDCIENNDDVVLCENCGNPFVQDGDMNVCCSEYCAASLFNSIEGYNGDLDTFYL